MQFQHLSSCYLQEAEWLHKNHKPRFEDRLHLGAMSIGATELCVYAMVCMGDEMPKGALEWALGYPDVVMACAKIGRLMNDLAASSKHRNNRDVANCVECYASEHNVTEEVAFAAIDSMIEDEWKTTNQARFKHGRQLLPAVQRVVNFTLSGPVYYGDRKDAFTFSSHLEDIIKSLFLKPIPI